MELSDVINNKWLNAENLKEDYLKADPFPHIVMEDFFIGDLLSRVENEFPDLTKLKDSINQFENEKEIKLASKGMRHLSKSALELNSYLQSDLMLNWLNKLTGIKEPLISDPYLAGGGYHEIKKGGLLKVHADFNKHSRLDLDRRLNLLIYLNKDWDESWGGKLELYRDPMESPVQSILPNFNKCVIFTTTSFTYHGHPDPLMCPEDRSRKSLAYYYFSRGRPANEVLSNKSKHNTLFRERENEKFKNPFNFNTFVKDICPPIILRTAKKVFKK